MTPDPDLQERQRREREFHDRWAEDVDPGQLDPARLAACPTTPETSYALAALGPLAGVRALDLGCGYGETTAWLALQGARVDAVDISPRMVEVSRRLAERCGVERLVTFHVSPGESLPFETGVFDVAFGHDVLHHLDLEKASAEIRRVLKPAGRAVFVEPLGHNPIINLFRDLSPETRTPDEVPLRFADFPRFARGFRSLRHREFQLSTLSLFLWFYFIERADPNKERYWKKIIVEAERYRRAFAVL
ncbi:MAG TPA: class I SAM-dependent methyltransferase, partial [Candidatus Polarisedimenticolia bacterium]|nr:class I SAM-dependent methyltransferase [Candidatus Polarisedimenticolia bacterium]